MRKLQTDVVLPRNVARNIVKRAARAAAEGESAIVLTVRRGRLSRVFGLKEYLKIKALPLTVKPHEYRKARQAVPDPLGAVDLGTVVSPLTREQIYE